MQPLTKTAFLGVAVCSDLYCYSLAGKSALEYLLDDSETRNGLSFQGPATLPPAPYYRQMQTQNDQNDFTEMSPLHNHHLSIFALIESFR